MAVQALRSTRTATSVRVRDAQTEITDGPFAVTKEVLAGYYVLECADLEEALAHGRADPGGALGDDRGAPGRHGRRVGGQTPRAAGADIADDALGEQP